MNQTRTTTKQPALHDAQPFLPRMAEPNEPGGISSPSKGDGPTSRGWYCRALPSAKLQKLRTKAAALAPPVKVLGWCVRKVRGKIKHSGVR